LSQQNKQYKSHHGGRPKSDPATVRHITIGVRVNEKEWGKLQTRSKHMGMSLAELLRTVALSRQLPAPPVPEVNRNCYAELAKLAVNLNQIARAANEGRCEINSNVLLRLRQEVMILQKELLGMNTDFIHNKEVKP